MPSCRTVFHAVQQHHVAELLSCYTREYYTDGRQAYMLEDGGFNIDAGENDIRAYYSECSETLHFFCRYERDKSFYDKRLARFAQKHQIGVRASSINDSGR